MVSLIWGVLLGAAKVAWITRARVDLSKKWALWKTESQVLRTSALFRTRAPIDAHALLSALSLFRYVFVLLKLELH